MERLCACGQLATSRTRKPPILDLCGDCMSGRQRSLTNSRNRQAYLTNPTLRLAPRLRHYKMSVADFYRMLDSQDGGCAICSVALDLAADMGARDLHIDHDRGCCQDILTCGECVRGILCCSCNVAVGHIEKINIDRVLGYLTRGVAA